MNKALKGVILISILLIPIFIFLFLKFFGENRFDIPVYYKEGVSAIFPYCETKNGPYKVENLNVTNLPGVYLFLDENEDFNLTDAGNINSRLKDAVGNVGYELYSMDSTIGQVTTLDSSQFIQKLRCEFITDTLNQYILVDSKSRIRGYYNTERDEIDRLIVELKILLENERNGIDRREEIQ